MRVVWGAVSEALSLPSPERKLKVSILLQMQNARRLPSGQVKSGRSLIGAVGIAIVFLQIEKWHASILDLLQAGLSPVRLASGRRPADCLDDVLISGASAEIGRQELDQVFLGHIRVVFEGADDQHQKARSAKSALQRVIVDKGLLQGMQLVAVGKRFDGSYFAALRLMGEHQAGADRLVRRR